MRHLWKKNKSQKWLSTDPKELCPLFFLLFGISDCALSILRIIDVERNIIGLDITTSIFLVCFQLSCYSGLTLYFQVILDAIFFLKRSTKMISQAGLKRLNDKFSVLKLYAFIFIPLSLPISFSIITSTQYPEYMQIFGKVTVTGVGIFTFLYGVLLITAYCPNYLLQSILLISKLQLT